jgi:hypothetical protein
MPHTALGRAAAGPLLSVSACAIGMPQAWMHYGSVSSVCGMKPGLTLSTTLPRPRQVPVLCCDEATAALDPATEANVLEIIERIFADRTILTIAHRCENMHVWAAPSCSPRSCKPARSFGGRLLCHTSQICPWKPTAPPGPSSNHPHLKAVQSTHTPSHAIKP